MKPHQKHLISLAAMAAMMTCGNAAEFHVAINGSDASPGTPTAPLRAIQRAADLAQPGDTVTVHAGVYRERVNPPRGGESAAKRITYQAAPGEQVVITGSEPVKGWEKVSGDTWKVTVPNAVFGKFNPYADLIHGDWFNANGRKHHTGCVYLNGDWFIEAADFDDVMKPPGATPLWFAIVDGNAADEPDCLMNIASFRVGVVTVPADKLAANNGTQLAACSEGGQCVGFIRKNNWVRYDGVDFGTNAESIEFRAAATSGAGGVIELHLGQADGELLGACDVAATGDWQKWQTFTTKIKAVSGVKNLCLVFKARPARAKAAKDCTEIFAQFQGVNPNEAKVEINVRQTVFTPENTGVNYLTVRGFHLCNAATPWAPPTAGQIGIISAFWCKGWIIENNAISHSICSGISLGKYGDEWDNKAGSAEGYVGTINRAVKNGWNKETIGHHQIRNNIISHCEQAGIVGSLGAVFSTVTGNVIHDIHVRQLFSGAEMSAIKFHGAIDVEISRNHIYRSNQGIWLDWMAQGARISGNLLHDNSERDLFFEVDHGPILVDNNILLSSSTIWHWSQGGAFVHNLISDEVVLTEFDDRKTPFHKAHSTDIAGLHDNPPGDDRFYNNVFVSRGDVSQYDKARLPVWMEGNVFLKGTKASKHENDPLIKADFDAGLRLVEKADGFYLDMAFENSWTAEQKRPLVTSALLGKASISGCAFENPDGSSITIGTDYFGKPRNPANPTPGPFEAPGTGLLTMKVWPISPTRETK